ncbi:hypothetical protein CDG76_02695 [Nostoc sp. 'Peltigera membranacea cyanobiont' 210A]|nr:hypothetical protein CDG76_02695 [Nostoc sp. 'Peltigera membranacea cyanobiont' 210A]
MIIFIVIAAIVLSKYDEVIQKFIIRSMPMRGVGTGDWGLGDKKNNPYPMPHILKSTLRYKLK